MSEEVAKEPKVSPKAKAKAETKVEEGTEPLIKSQQAKAIKREVLPDGTIVEDF